MSPSSVVDSSEILLVGTTDWVGVFEATLEARTDASVRTVPTAAAALDTLRGGSFDCVVAEYDLDASTGIRVLRSIRDETTTLPVLLCTASGNESVASEAVRAGVTDYVTASEPPDGVVDELLERTERCIREAQRAIARRDRARQFDAIFHDTRTATWVLDLDGSLARANRTAREMIDEDVGAVIGERFWALPWWSREDGIHSDVRRVVETALAGGFGNAVVLRPDAGDGTRAIDLSARSVRTESGTVASIVVEERNPGLCPDCRGEMRNRGTPIE
ncbi:response regulator [Haloferacaceae archaeon DSL9]